MNKKKIIHYLSENIKYTKEQMEIIKAIDEARMELERARQYFEMVSDSKLIDYAIYMEEAAKARYSYLIGEARKFGITVNCRSVLNEVSAM